MLLRKNWQIPYAVLLIVLVPLAIALNTLFLVNRFRATVDAGLRHTALTIGSMVNATVADRITDTAKLQERIDRIVTELPEVHALDILKPDGKDFTVIASTYKDAIGRTVRGEQNVFFPHGGEAIAYRTESGRSAALDRQLTPEEVRGDVRYWGVLMPLKDADGKDALLLSMKMSSAETDGLVRGNLLWSYAWLAVTVLMVILILAANTRLFPHVRLYRRLQEVDRMKDDFISTASHELHPPIAALRGYLSLFLDGAFGKLDEKPRQAMNAMMAVSAHLGVLAEDLLEACRIAQGRMKMDLRELSVEPVIAEVVEQLRFDAQRKNLAFEFRTPESPLPHVSADRFRLMQVLINLCSNAITYTPAGSVTVTADLRDGNMVEIRVTDTGLGMSVEAREKLFQKFYRVKTDETAAIPGTGLGLWIAKQVTERMHGKIHCDSIERVGTQMSVTFPAIAVKKAEIAAPMTPTVS